MLRVKSVISPLLPAQVMFADIIEKVIIHYSFLPNHKYLKVRHVNIYIMGKLQAGILGVTTGKVGNVVGSKWRNINTLKVYQPNPRNPNTPGQVAQRLNLSNVTQFCRKVLAGIRTGFKNFNTAIPQYSNAMSANMLIWNEQAAATLLDIRTQLLISKGNLTKSGNLVSNIVTSAIVDVSVAALKAAEYTKLRVVCYNFDRNESSEFTHSLLPADTTADITFPSPFGTVDGDEVQIFMFGYDDLTGDTMDSLNISTAAEPI